MFFSGSIDEMESSIIGLILIFISLLFDGIVGGLQQGLNGSSYENMFFVNMWSFCFTTILLLVNGTVFAFQRSLKLFGLSLSMGIGQVFIFAMISKFGPLACSLTTTTRKFFSIMLSILLHGHTLALQEWIGMLLVFCGLLSNIKFN